MEEVTCIYNVWAELLKNVIEYLDDREILDELQSFGKKDDCIRKFKPINLILQKVINNSGNITITEKNKIIMELKKYKDDILCYIYMLVVLFDNYLPDYELMYSNIHSHIIKEDNTIVEPLNTEYGQQHIKIYPYIKSGIGDKSKTDLILSSINGFMCKHMFIMEHDEKDIKFIYHYLDDFFGESIVDGKLKIAVSPICDYAKHECWFDTSSNVNKIRVGDIINKEEVQERCLSILKHMLDAGANIIVFPELMGMSELVDKFRYILNDYEDNHLIYLPSYMENGYNTGICLYGRINLSLFT